MLMQWIFRIKLIIQEPRKPAAFKNYWIKIFLEYFVFQETIYQFVVS